MNCRQGCGACCIAPSITSPLPNMPLGKPAGTACANLDLSTFKCRIWGEKNYPQFCADYQACQEFCGETREEALQNLFYLDKITQV